MQTLFGVNDVVYFRS